MSDEMPIVRLRGVAHRYGRHVVLENLDVTVPPGVIYALVGANGAGKTTLLQLLTGVARPAQGTVEILGTPVAQLTTAQRQQITYVAEGQRLPEWMTVDELVAFCAPLYATWDASLARSLRDRFALPRAQRIGTLSRGQRMKAALLCALAPRPRLLIMDEPFTGIDVAVRDELVSGLLDAAGTEGQSLLISTHDLAEIDTLADWVGVLANRRLTLESPLESLREQPGGRTLKQLFLEHGTTRREASV